MVKKTPISTCLTPELVKTLRFLKRTEVIKSVSGAIREVVEEKYAEYLKTMKNQRKITEFK